MESKETIWIPFHEYEAHKELMSKMDIEAINKMRYFFWNNFSDEGYEEWKNKCIENVSNLDGRL